VRAVGLPIADYFIWNDDFEFTTRLLRDRVGLACSASIVEHRTRTFGSTDADPGSRFEFEVRNKLWMFIRSDALRARERLQYGGATGLRWLRTLWRSRQRRLLLAAALTGARTGLTRAPRATSEVLADCPSVAEAVLKLERRH
jgi:hypothetical protein